MTPAPPILCVVATGFGAPPSPPAYVALAGMSGGAPNLPVPAPESHAGFVLVYAVAAGRDWAVPYIPVRGGPAAGDPNFALLLGSTRGALSLNGRFNPDMGLGALLVPESAPLQELVR